VLYLPPYLLDLNPIEEAFAKVKALSHRAAARGHESLSRRGARPSTRSPLRMLTASSVRPTSTNDQ
jgi:transposase